MTQTIINLGTGGAVLNGQNGSTTGADSNDAKFLDRSDVNYVYLPGVAGNYLSVPDEAALDITGDIDIRVQVAMDDWTPAATSTFISKRLSTGDQRSFSMGINTTGILNFQWSIDGTAPLNARSATVTTGISDGQTKWVRATLDVDNGSSGNDVKFFLSDDGATWTQLGTTVTTAGVTSIHSGTAPVTLGTTQPSIDMLAGKVYRAQIYSDLTETNKVLDVDTSVITTGAATTFTALTGQTVTISRSTAGRKTVAVVSPVWLFGTDDFMQVADDDLIDFGAAESFTVLAVVRQWATTANMRVVWKGLNLSGARWGINSNAATQNLVLNDGTNSANTAGVSAPYGTLCTIAGKVDRVSALSTTTVNSTVSAGTSTASLGSVANASNMRVGVSSDFSNPSDMELLAVAVFRRALTATEITAITTYYQARLS
jgi:hypothetical protein